MDTPGASPADARSPADYRDPPRRRRPIPIRKPGARPSWPCLDALDGLWGLRFTSWSLQEGRRAAALEDGLRVSGTRFISILCFSARPRSQSSVYYRGRPVRTLLPQSPLSIVHKGPSGRARGRDSDDGFRRRCQKKTGNNGLSFDSNRILAADQWWKMNGRP